VSSGKTASHRNRRLRIAIAKTAEEIGRCHKVMRELRPEYPNRKKFVERIVRQQGDGYLLAFLEARGEIRAVAGYRFLESLFSGRFLYVDDLVTRARDRSAGYGGKLFDWLVEQAREQNCAHLELDSGVQRFDAHRFYLVKRMKIASYHFLIGTESKAATTKPRRTN
jgi:GNAT superfamily N-acetyltransferase